MNNKIYIIFIFIFITFLNIYLYIKNNQFYKNVKNINDPSSILVLVNKNNKLDTNYIPPDLELINLEFANKNKYLRHIAKIAFENLSRDAKKEGYKIIAVSAYRSYTHQSQLFLQYKKNKGIRYAIKCSAKEGYSEHQTGLSIDIMGSNNDYNKFEESKEFKWMINNAYKYGFILRYPKGKYYITGFKYEPWHWRYVGVDTATYIKNNNITLEEYTKKHTK